MTHASKPMTRNDLALTPTPSRHDTRTPLSLYIDAYSASEAYVVAAKEFASENAFARYLFGRPVGTPCRGWVDKGITPYAIQIPKVSGRNYPKVWYNLSHDGETNAHGSGVREAGNGEAGDMPSMCMGMADTGGQDAPEVCEVSKSEMER